jgi:hypothetical protein
MFLATRTERPRLDSQQGRRFLFSQAQSNPLTFADRSLLSSERTIMLTNTIIIIIIIIIGARGSVVIKALCCKPEGRGFKSRWGGFF